MRAATTARAISLAVLAFGVLPLVVSEPAPFVDWPNHLARVAIGVGLLRGDPFWRAFYTFNPRPVPNEALDFGIGALHLAGLSIDVAGLLFLVATYLVCATGFLRLARALGAADSSKPLLIALLFCTGPLMYGLVNYILGLGLGMWLLATWLPASPARRWVLAILGTLLLFYVHLLAAAIWVLFAGCVDLADLRTNARRGLAAIIRSASSLGAAFAFLLCLLASPTAQDSLPRADGSNVFYMGQGSALEVLRWKAAVFVRFFTDHAGLANAVGTWVVIVALAVCVALSARARMRRPIAAGLLICLAGIAILPESAGDGSLLDYRLVLPTALFAAAALRLRWRSRRAGRVAFVLLASLVLARTAMFASAFAQEAAVFRAADAVMRTLPEGSIMLTARGRADDHIGVQEWWSPPMEHVSTRAVLHHVLVPTVFADASQHPIVLDPALKDWRNEWRISNATELTSFLTDIEPLCRAAAAQDREVFLFLAYPGASTKLANPDALVVATPAFRIYDACHLGFPPRFAAFE